MRRLLTIFLIILAGAFLAIPFVIPTRYSLLHRPVHQSRQILDCHGSVLRDILSEQEYISHYCTLDSISPYMIMATLASEDKRFFMHNGIDFIAIARSALRNTIEQKVLSGASTITQQLARILLNSKSRDIFSKIREAFLALIIELKLNKIEILELYLNSAPYGNLTHGIEAAAQMYFRKPARDLTSNESALLAILPRAPSYYNPYHYPERAICAQRDLLIRMNTLGYTDSASTAVALLQPLAVVAKEKNFVAPHFCEYVLNNINRYDCNIFRIGTTIDPEIQETVEKIINNNLNRLEDANVNNAAAMVLELNDLELRAYVGSNNFFDPISGEVDGIQSLRQPGSAIKPFTYAIAIENGATLADLIPDLPTYEATTSGDYHPRNYDEKFHGLVRLRTALACSYNIPAVKVLEKIGIDELWRYLKHCGFNRLSQSPVHYGLGLTLGNGEVTLFELTRAFSIFASNGEYRSICFIRLINDRKILPDRKRVRIFQPATAYLISEILTDNNARSPAFGELSPLNLPFYCPVKTGTSKDYRDNWCIGYTNKYIVGVWVGNFDGSPMNQVSGITGAAPIFRDIMLFLHRNSFPIWPAKPESIVAVDICALSGELPGIECENVIGELFIKGNAPKKYCDHALARINNKKANDLQFNPVLIRQYYFSIVFPDNSDIYKIDPILRPEYQKLRLQIATTYDLKEVTWSVDGEKLGTVNYPYTYYWQLKSGTHTITAAARDGNENKELTDSVKISVLE